jgi:hypothetical protein
MWDILKENSTGKCGHDKIEKISSDKGVLTDNQAIADEFNKFFSSVGEKSQNLYIRLTGSQKVFCPMVIPFHLNWGSFRKLNLLI